MKDKYEEPGGRLMLPHPHPSPQRKLISEALARIEGVRETRAGGGLIFGIDLTASREESLREARIATAAMFDVLRSIAADRLAVKLVYYRGQECRASGWEHDPAVLRRAMEKLSCKAGATQITEVLRLALAEKKPLSGVVFIGDVIEEERDELAEIAERLGERNIPLFVFHDYGGRDVQAVEAAGPEFEYLAELTGGAYCRFGAGAAAALRELLSTVAAFSAGGIEAVKQVPRISTPEARQLRTRLLLGPGGDGK
jgi:hypothetical protein